MQNGKAPIFILGLHRTGSTLWHNLISMYPEICRLTETRFLGAWWQRDFRDFAESEGKDLFRDENIDRMVDLMFSGEDRRGLESGFWRLKNFDFTRSPEFKRSVASAIKASDRSLADIVRVVLEKMCVFSNCQRVCVKFPVDFAHVPRLIKWFPDCKIMHISRDPRAVCMSKTNDPFGTALHVERHPHLRFVIRRAMVLFTVFQYVRASRFHGRYKHLQNYRLFLYEDLLADPRATARQMCEFLELEFREEILDLQSGVHEHQKSSLTGKRRKAFDRRAASRWKCVISPLEERLITLLTKRSMRRLNYHPERHAVFGFEPLDVEAVPAARNR